MHRRYQARTNRRNPAKRINNDVWKQYQPRLKELYKIRGLPLPEVMKKMESQYSFKATTKQYRYRLGQVWGWMKYNHGTYQSPKTQVDSDGDTELHIPDTDPGCLPTPDNSDIDGDERKASYQDILTLCTQFLSVFSDDCCYPVHEESISLLPNFIAEIEPYYDFPNANHSPVLKKLVHGLSQTILPRDGSINVIDYHRLNFALRHLLDKLGENPGPGFPDGGGDTLLITRLNVLEEQMWYRNFQENSPLPRYLQSCFDFCKERILSNKFGGDAMVPPPFNSLGKGEDDDEANTFRKDACLFVYLWDAWTCTHSESFSGTKSNWDRLAVPTLGITPTMVLNTMSSLILAVAADPSVPPASSVIRQHRWCMQPQNYGDNSGLFDLAREGVHAIESWPTRERRKYLVSEFIREFVWMHDMHGMHDSSCGFGSPGINENAAATRVERDARLAAQEYIKQWKLRKTGLSVDYQESGEEEDARADRMDIEISKGDGEADDGGVDIWGVAAPLDDDISVVSEEE
ncbi:hypothetical protein F5X96DRAFT_694096 [Biscogniauxia mediterranea]|nr:hypothetical protein F5X96DRAFT_694096 [Biscogniauxia mediterranea]